MMATFLGIDLAWRSDRNPSGAAVLRGDHHGAELVSVAEPLTSLEEVKRWVAAHIEGTSLVAIDAPLVITNSTGQRPCEREVGRRYGARHASCHTSNLSLYPDASSVQLASWLHGQGFRHASEHLTARTMLEVYPHAAFVALFDLPTVIKYKKGTVTAKCTGLTIVQSRLRSLALSEAPLKPNKALEVLLNQDPSALRGQLRKSYEDSLDAVFCAYLAYYLWRLGEAASEVFGNAEQGYIVNPRLRQQPGGAAAA